MALGAGLSEAGGHVVWTGGALIILQVAGHAGRAGQVEVVVDVAVGALARWNRMSAGEWKTCGAVIEVRIQPRIHAMAEGAVGGEAARNVVRAGC